MGVFYSLFASFLFGGLYYLATFLTPLAGEEIFGIRIFVTLPFLLLAIFILKKQREFLDYCKRLKKEPKLWFIMLITASLVGSQMWLFLWAPNSGKAIDVSIGYLLMPIAMVMVGKWFYKEHLSPLKWCAVSIAFIGVLSNVLQTGTFSWAVAFVMIGYPLYFMLRRYFNISHIYSFTFEIILLTPIAFYFILPVNMESVYIQNPHIYTALFLLGLMSGVALTSYTMASYLIPFNLLGLLGYIEPVLMMSISFIIGEVLQPEAYILFICLIISVLFILLDGILTLHKQRKKQ